MALLPLHAAGEHSLGSTENTMSHVVSSYIPTLKALQFARKKTWVPPTAKKSRFLVVAMHKTPGQDDLNVADEIDAIQQHMLAPLHQLKSLKVRRLQLFSTKS